MLVEPQGFVGSQMLVSKMRQNPEAIFRIESRSNVDRSEMEAHPAATKSEKREVSVPHVSVPPRGAPRGVEQPLCVTAHASLFFNEVKFT